MGSGFLTHGLPFLRDCRFDATPPGWSTEFDHWAADAAAEPQPVTTITGYWLGLAKRSFQVA